MKNRSIKLAMLSLVLMFTACENNNDGIATEIAEEDVVVEEMVDEEMMDDEIMEEEVVTRIGSFRTVSDYVSSGDVQVVETETGINIVFASNYRADNSLPGFAMYLSNSPTSLVNALEIDAFDDADGVQYAGAHNIAVSGVAIDAYKYLVHWCRPFEIVVGQAELTADK